MNNETPGWVWGLLILLILASVGAGIWWFLLRKPAPTNVSNLTATFTCASANAGALATFYDSLGGLGFIGSASCPSGYTSETLNGNTLCYKPVDESTIQPGPAALTGLQTCFPNIYSTGSGRHLGAIDPPCPSKYKLVNGTFCNPPEAPCPAGFTVNPIDPKFCVPPEAVDGKCATGTLRNGKWCVPN